MQNYAIFPMQMLYDEKYKDFSTKEFFLYMLLLNRVNLSRKNLKHFSDKNGIFIYFSYKQITQFLNCTDKTATKTLNNLERAGLIRREYQKIGLPLKIYVNDIRECVPKNAAEMPQDKSFNKPYSDSINRQKANTDHSQRNDKQASFDTEISLSEVQKNRRSFGDKKVHKTKKKTEN